MERRAIFLLIFSAVFVLALLAFWRGNIPIAAQGSLLDGKTFIGEFGKKGEKAEGRDELTFQNGKFHSAACDRYRFGDGAYTIILGDGMNGFVAETASVKEGKTCEEVDTHGLMPVAIRDKRQYQEPKSGTKTWPAFCWKASSSHSRPQFSAWPLIEGGIPSHEYLRPSAKGPCSQTSSPARGGYRATQTLSHALGPRGTETNTWLAC